MRCIGSDRTTDVEASIDSFLNANGVFHAYCPVLAVFVIPPHRQNCLLALADQRRRTASSGADCFIMFLGSLGCTFLRTHVWFFQETSVGCSSPPVRSNARRLQFLTISTATESRYVGRVYPPGIQTQPRTIPAIKPAAFHSEYIEAPPLRFYCSSFHDDFGHRARKIGPVF